MKRPVFFNGGFYHVYNRGVDKRNVFMDNKDYFRFIHDLYEFNDQNPAPNLSYYSQKSVSSSKEVGLPKIENRQPRKLLVEILVFCLMPNHFHLLLKQLVDNGISLFMQKLGSGYTNFFNLKYERSGALFQGKFKAIQVTKENYLLQLASYQHLNPIELIEPRWREEGIQNFDKIRKFFENYRWSSYLDYIGKNNFPSILDKNLLTQYFPRPEDYKKYINDWLVKDFGDINDLLLEK